MITLRTSTIYLRINKIITIIHFFTKYNFLLMNLILPYRILEIHDSLIRFVTR